MKRIVSCMLIIVIFLGITGCSAAQKTKVSTEYSDKLNAQLVTQGISVYNEINNSINNGSFDSIDKAIEYTNTPVYRTNEKTILELSTLGNVQNYSGRDDPILKYKQCWMAVNLDLANMGVAYSSYKVASDMDEKGLTGAARHMDVSGTDTEIKPKEEYQKEYDKWKGTLKKDLKMLDKYFE